MAPHIRAWNLVVLTPLPPAPPTPVPAPCQQHEGRCTCLLAIFRIMVEHLIPTLWSEEDNACYVNPVAIIVGHLMGQESRPGQNKQDADPRRDQARPCQ